MWKLDLRFEIIGFFVCVLLLAVVAGALAGACLAMPFAVWSDNFDLLKTPAKVGSIALPALIVVALASDVFARRKRIRQTGGYASDRA